MILKPTKEEKAIIRDCAQRSAGRPRVEICPSTRCSLTTGREAMNICLVTDEPHWDDTDLADNSFRWADFTRGIELAPDGRAIVDFWVYEVAGWKELRTNVTAFWAGGKLARVKDCDAILWEATA